jgi:uncharacterized protein (TIGR03067 family)
MYRSAFLCAALVALTVSSTPAQENKKELPREYTPFQGTWRLIEAKFGGTPIPQKEKDGEQIFKFEGNILTVEQKGKSEPGTYAIDAKKKPSTIDLTSDKKMEKVSGIYEFDKDGNKLTLCLGVGKDAVPPKAFDEAKTLLIVLEKVIK